jgi:chromosome segregation ATPase
MPNPTDDIPSVAEAKAKAAAEEQQALHQATTVIGQAKRFVRDFGALLQASEWLAEAEAAQRTRGEVQQQTDRMREELAVLSGQRDTELQKLTARIETGLKAQYAESEALLARQHTLANEVMAATADLAEKRKVLTDLERRTDTAEARHRDVLGKLSSLRGSIPSAA